ncbi:response regulator [Massilia sp. TWR1-2-2]|uniref:response regulator n=1 Tax=Massilia sp. TWR1-2-2 TaxID=2804584 RepID=UPI003CF5D7D0
MGNEVCTEFHPIAALTRADLQTFDLFILDIGLPGMDGYELARQLRAKPCACAALFMALTGYGSPEDIKRSMESGFHYHFTKPMNLQALARILGVPDFFS